MFRHFQRDHSDELLEPEQEIEFPAKSDHFEPGTCEADSNPSILAGCSTEIVRYESLFDLMDHWQRLDSPAAGRFSVVLVLQAGLRLSLPELIRRQFRAQRLVIASTDGCWPGFVSPGDLALHSSALGWHEISYCRNLSAAVADAMESGDREERCILFYPEEMDRDEIPFSCGCRSVEKIKLR